MRKDNLRLGLILGLLVPILGTFVYYFIQFRNVATLSEFFQYLTQERGLFTAMISILLVVNIAIFTYYINTRNDKTAKGIFIVTIVYGLASVIWKFFL
jgi:hypothetical protein